jgi:hypothetical protein
VPLEPAGRYAVNLASGHSRPYRPVIGRSVKRVHVEPRLARHPVFATSAHQVLADPLASAPVKAAAGAGADVASSAAPTSGNAAKTTLLPSPKSEAPLESISRRRLQVRNGLRSASTSSWRSSSSICERRRVRTSRPARPGSEPGLAPGRCPAAGRTQRERLRAQARLRLAAGKARCRLAAAGLVKGLQQVTGSSGRGRRPSLRWPAY